MPTSLLSRFRLTRSLPVPAEPEAFIPPPDQQPHPEDHIRFLAESLPEIVWTALPDGRVDYMNRRWFAYTGLNEEETYSERKSAVHPDDYVAYKKKWDESVRTGKPYEMTYRFRRASDRMYRWHIGRALPVRDTSGHIVKWFGTCVDVHAQKEAEEQVRTMNEQLEFTVGQRTMHLQKEIRQRRRAEERHQAQLQLLQSMIDLFPMAAAAADLRGGLLHANGSFRALFGLEGDNLTLPLAPYLGALGIVRTRFPSAACDAAVRAMQGATEPVRREIPGRQGRTFCIEYIPAVEAAAESGFLLLIRDISQEKKVDAAKSEFMSLASHQLRTPLTAIRWALGRLSRQLQGKLEPPEAQLLQRARKGAMTMAQTITTMLSISRIEAGLLSPSAADTALEPLLRSIWEEFAASCDVHGFTLTLDCPPDVRLHTDAVMLREIIENLLSNAMKYTPDGGAITLRAGREDGRVLLRVRDTGYGIPVHQQKEIFTKFFRGENVTKIDTQGTGLGLYLVSQLAEALGGSITFTSEEGKGTEFTLELPIAA